MGVLIPQTSSEDRAAGGLRADASTWFGMGLHGLVRGYMYCHANFAAFSFKND